MRSTKFVYAKYVIFPQLLAKALPRRETNNARLCGAPHTLKKVRRCVEIPMQKKEFRPLPPLHLQSRLGRIAMLLVMMVVVSRPL